MNDLPRQSSDMTEQEIRAVLHAIAHCLTIAAADRDIAVGHLAELVDRCAFWVERLTPEGKARAERR